MDWVLNALFYLGVLLAGLSLLIIVHELGHFLPAKWFGMRVEKFYLFFDWPRKLWSTQRGATEYGVGLLPLGGYVKISGIIDESFDKAHLQQPVQPWEFRAKPVWQRIIVMVGGVTMNVLLAIVLFSALAFWQGEQYLRNDSLVHGLYVPAGSVGEELGFKTGDKLLSCKGEPIVAFPLGSELVQYLIDQDVYFTVLRGSDTLRLEVENNYLNRISDRQKAGEWVLLQPNFLPIVSTPEPDYPGAKAGLAAGDRILSIDSKPILHFGDMRPLLQQRRGETTHLVVQRGKDTLQLSVALDSTGLLGVQADDGFLQYENKSYGFFGGLAHGTSRAFGVIGGQVKAFRKMFAGDIAADKNLAGPVRIGQYLGDSVKSGGAAGFLAIVATLSMILAFVNILPIPALDGGHLVFLLWEVISGREPSTRVRIAAQQVGVLLVIALSVFVIANDILNL